MGHTLSFSWDWTHMENLGKLSKNKENWASALAGHIRHGWIRPHRVAKI